MNDTLIRLVDRLEEDVEDALARGQVTGPQLSTIKCEIDMIKDIETIIAMREYGDEEESWENGYSGRMPYMRGHSGNRNYSDRMSGRRGRDSMGRYTSRGIDESQSMQNKLQHIQDQLNELRM